MKIAVMQPYFFPYIGYFELMASVDKFVFLNDVQYIRRGWVNRNRIQSRSKDFQYLTVPVVSHSRDSLIKDIQVAPRWVEHHEAILRHTYGASDHPLLSYYASLGKYSSLQELLFNSLIWTARWLGLVCEFEFSEGISTRKGSGRIVDICNHFKADVYCNLSGGRGLYCQDDFGDVVLEFMNPTSYHNCFSIIDVLLTEEEKAHRWLHSATPNPVSP